MYNEKTPFVLYGGDYNPDQWDDATIDKDMELFKEAGVNLVTLPMFSWAKLEPEEGRYEFEWLDKIVDKLWANNIYVCLATPTTAQPAWLSKKYPEVLPVDIAGRKRTHGMRVFFCVNSVKYRERAAAIAKEMAKRYSHIPGLVAWHIANEYGTYCYCDQCQSKFRQWLEKRYGTIEKLNEKWNTTFWGRIVYNFDEIMVPTELNDDYRFNPIIQLDYMRFMTDSTLECYLNEADIIKEYIPNIPVFSNISGFIKKLNQFKLVEHMDCAGWDNYPGPRDHPSLPALKHDIMRALKDGQSYIIAEQSPNQQNWQPYNKLKRPGEVRTIAYQGLARGGDTCLYFQMRQSIGGQEKFHGAFIGHGESNDTRIFKELTQLGQEFKKLGDAFIGGRTQSEIGILFDWDNWWALELTSGPTKDMDYLSQVNKYYKAFYDQNLPVDILKVTSSLDSYKIVMAPLLYMEKEGIAEKVAEFMKNGGIFIATYMTGLVDENDRCVFGTYPGKYRDLLGIEIDETDALYPDEDNLILTNKNLFGDERSYKCGFLCDIIHLKTAQSLATYGKDFYKDTPCITKNEFGKGSAYYIGSEPEESFLADFVQKITQEKDINPLFKASKNIEIATRKNKKGEVTFVINHGDETGMVEIGNEEYINLLNDNVIQGNYEISGRDVMVLKRKK